MNALVTFSQRLEASLTTPQRALARQREALRLGIDAGAWLTATTANLDVELMRALHRAVTGDKRTVRQALRDGAWTIADAEPGKLRPKAQAFRIGEHIEPAWDQSKLKAGLVELLQAAAPRFASDPIGAAARLLVGLSRAQPFVGDNERTALAIAAWALRGAGLPSLHAVTIEQDAAYGEALIAAADDDRTALERYLTAALWNEALALAEWIAPVPPPGKPWTLANEHAVLDEARRSAMRIATGEVEAFADRASELFAQALGLRLAVSIAPVARQWLDTPAPRLQETWNSLTRGHPVCPHEPILVARWQVGGATSALGARLTIASAGRGISGALSVQLALEVAEHPTSRAPAMVLVPDEDPDTRHARFEGWARSAIDQVIAESPLRG